MAVAAHVSNGNSPDAKTAVLRIRVKPAVRREFLKVCADLDMRQGDAVEVLVRGYKSDPKWFKGDFK